MGDLFRWLEGAEIAPALAPLVTAANEEVLWTPLEEVRFAAVNHLCVELGYQGRTRLIEPYSLRRTRDGNLVLHALRHESGEHRSYRVDRVQSARSKRPVHPTYAVKFSSAGPLAASPSTRRSTTSTRAPSLQRTTRTGPVYVIECPVCGNRFDRTTHSRKLNAHKNPYGTRCPRQGRNGYLVDTRW